MQFLVFGFIAVIHELSSFSLMVIQGEIFELSVYL